MKEKILNILKSDLFFAVILNLVIMLFCIEVTTFSYDSGKDFYHSLYICHQHFYYSSSINYILSTLIGSIQYVFDGFNCFVLSQILLSYAAFVSITFVFADKYSKRKSAIISFLINILFALNHYADIHSSKTAALLITAGFLLLLNSINNKRYNLPCWIGAAEVAFGSFFDYKYFFIGLAFAVAFFIGDLISKRKYKIAFRKFFWYFRPFLIVFALVTLLVTGLNQYSYSVNHATEEATNYYEYEQVTDSISTLPYPNYADHKEELKSVGITTENEYELLKSGYVDNDNSLNTETLKVIRNIQQRENSKTIFFVTGNIFTDISYHLSVFDCYAIIYIVFLALSVIFIVFHKRRFAFFPFLYIATGIIASIFMRYIFSGETYLIYGIWLMMYVFLMYSFNFEQARPHKNPPVLRMNNSYIFISGVSVICLFLCYSAVFQSTANPIKESESPQSLFAEIDRHPDRYYVLDPNTSNEYMKYTENYIHPLWGFRQGFLENVDGFGYFHNSDELRKRNMSENIYEAVLTYNKIYVIDKNITFKKERYFTLKYAENGKTVSYNQISEIDGYKIYTVTQK